jgi:Ca2+-binding RTX toxin-like protein
MTKFRSWTGAVLGLVLGLTVLGDLEPRRAHAAPAGQGFTLNAADLRFILKQIKISEAHATREGPDGAPVPGRPLFGTGPDQIASPLLPYGLRTVDGSYNNGVADQSHFGAAGRLMPRLTTPTFRDAEKPGQFGPPDAPATSYAQKKGLVVDSHPRLVSNLIVDQTVTNPAAVAAAGTPHRNYNRLPSAAPCTAPGQPAGCTPAGETLFIPNVTTDVGLSPPYNSWFTLFGQFFDHGLDSTAKAGGTVFVPLKADDPLIAGPDHVTGNADDLPPSQQFMVLTRAKNQPGQDGILGDNPATEVDESLDDVQEATNTDSPWVDQSQTYSSHPSHQVFLRGYANVGGRPMADGTMLEGRPGGMATWADVKKQAADVLGIRLTDRDVLNIPMVAADEYGRFLRGPDRGLPQLVTATGLVEGDTAAPVALPEGVRRINIAFLDDIAHHAVPGTFDHDGNRATPPIVQTPDDDGANGGTTDDHDPATYDDEMLGAHFVAGDGRANENIGLTAIHQVFHSEHNRLVGHVKDVLTADTSATGVAALAEWKSESGVDGWSGERLFQAARFVTEMEYQHLVFEEFGRKMQPGINPFNVFTQSDTAINPAITAEFAHAVYRFGHSMLTDTVARTNNDGSQNDIPLLNAFLNPPSFYDNGNGGQLSPEDAAGSVAMGMTDQIANELDEFVTEALRNNLLGLPLDLATLNLARAREAGVPSLNNVRKELYRGTHDSSLQPYSNWVDFGLSLKHSTSVVNFMAAYGKHPTIVAADTAAKKRAAAQAIYADNPAADPAPPADAADFVNSTGAWASTPAGVSKTGLDDVDLWIGGLAESQNLFGGLLGSTFNYVFERQMTDLQDGDRLYYLSRTSGLNLRTQLEGNSFAEIVMRNTNAESLKADVFGTADCEFELGHATFQGTGNTIADDPASECDESKLLIRMADGTIRYRQTNTVDPAGLNAQSTYNGTSGADRIWGGVDNDTFWGNDGRDRIEGNDGADTALGGDGNDIITDSAGDDVHKGGNGNDAMEMGPGLDIAMGGFGHDFINGGANSNETFAGEGNDLVIAGDGADTVFGGGGDDWQEGGNGNDLLQGDSGAPFFDDINDPGHDVLSGGSNEDDYDAEGGDDIMLAGPGIERNHGAFGFDWSTHVRDPQPAAADLTIAIAAGPAQLADRYLATEALSGGPLDDSLKGDDLVPSAVDAELGGEAGLNALNAAGIARIAGLAGLLPAGATRFDAGNIVIGGGGNDRIEGRGADDIIDGDAYLDVRLSVRTDPANPATEVRSATSLTELQADVFAGTLDPGDIVIVREIKQAPSDGDVAVFSGPRADYDVTPGPNGLTVAHVRGTQADGTDTVRNIERLEFSDQPVTVEAPGAPTIGAASAGDRTADVTWTAPAGDGGSPITAYQVQAFTAASAAPVASTTVAASAARVAMTGLTNGTAYTFKVRARNDIAGYGPLSAASGAVTPSGPTPPPPPPTPGPTPAPTPTPTPTPTAPVPSVPGAPTIGTVTRGNASAIVRWTAPVGDGGSPITGYDVRVHVGNSTTVSRTAPAGPTATQLTVPRLTNGTAYRFDVVARNAAGAGRASARSAAVTPATVPGRPVIRTASSGAPGGGVNATARWSQPATGGSAITGYRVQAVRILANGRAGATIQSTLRPATARSYGFTLPAGNYRFTVTAVNAAGTSLPSARSNLVRAR